MDLNIFYKDPYYRFKPIKRFKRFLRNIKLSIQRIKYGFCERDIFNLDHFLAGVIANSIRYLNAHKHYDMSEVYEDYDKDLDRLAYLMEYSVKETPEEESKEDGKFMAWVKLADMLPREDERVDKAFNEWHDQCVENWKNQTARQHCAFELLDKYFETLWD